MSDPVAWGMDAASAVSVDTMRANGATFICCYLAPYPSQSWKMRTPAQIKEYVSAGFDVVFNWESDGTPGNGYSTGVDAAKQAQAQLYDRGFANAPVIFTFADSESPSLTLLDAAIAGAVSVLGHDRVGAYGGIAVIRHLADQDACRYYWQTYAWSGGGREPRAQLYQRQNTKTYDYDVAYAHDYGQATLDRSGGNSSAVPGTSTGKRSTMDVQNWPVTGSGDIEVNIPAGFVQATTAEVWIGYRGVAGGKVDAVWGATGHGGVGEAHDVLEASSTYWHQLNTGAEQPDQCSVHYDFAGGNGVVTLAIREHT